MTHPNFIEFLDSALEIGRLKTVLDETGEAKLSVPVGFCPLILSKLRESFTCLYIARDEIEAEAIFESLNSLGVQAVFFPDIDVIPYSNVFPSSDKLSDRINTLYKLTAPEPGIAVLTAESFIRKLPPKKYFDKSIRRYRVGSRIDREELTALLVRFSYIREAKVTAQGGFAIRGDIIDIFPPNYSEGVRISLFGDEIESIKLFHPIHQTSILPLEEFVLVPASEFALEKEKGLEEFSDKLTESHSHSHFLKFYSDRSSILDYCGDNALVLYHENTKFVLDDVIERYASALPHVKLGQDAQPSPVPIGSSVAPT